MTEKDEAHGLQSNQWLKAVHLASSDTLSPTENEGALRPFYEAHLVPELTLQHRQAHTISSTQYTSVHCKCALKCGCQSKISCELILYMFVIKVATLKICFDIFTVTIHRTKKKYMNGDEKHQNLVCVKLLHEQKLAEM